MTVFDELKLMNYSIIDYLKTTGASIGKNELIKEIFKDEACFFKMAKKEAFFVLKTLKVSDNMLEDTYMKLVNKQEYNRLFNAGKINEDDEELKIKYERVKDEFANDLTQNHMNILPVIHYKEQSWYKKLFYTIKNLFKKNDK